MALLPRTPPPRKGYSHYITNAVFSSVYICEKPTSLAYKVEKHFQDKPIIALKNFGKWIRKKQSLFSTGSPGERKYASRKRSKFQSSECDLGDLPGQQVNEEDLASPQINLSEKVLEVIPETIKLKFQRTHDLRTS